MSTYSLDDPPTSTITPAAYDEAPLAQSIIPKGTGRHSGSYFGAAGPWLAPPESPCIGLQGKYGTHSLEYDHTPGPVKSSHVRQSSIRGFLSKPKCDIPSSVTSLDAFATLDNLNLGQSHIHSPQPVKPLETTETIPAAPSSPRISIVSPTSSLDTEAKQQEFARELFEQHGVGRPTGWFSDDEDLSLLGDRTADHRRFRRICHVCSARTWSQTYCSSCKHRLCAKCVCEVPAGTEAAHADFLHTSSHTPKPDEPRTGHQKGVYRRLEPGPTGSEKSATPTSVTVAASSSRNLPSILTKRSPSVVADKERTGSTVESHPTELSTVQESPYETCSRQHTDNPAHGEPSPKIECDNPICRSTHEGHHLYRHSITCSLYRIGNTQRSRASQKDSQASDKVSVVRVSSSQSRKEASRPIDIAHWHHYSGFHHSHHSHRFTTFPAVDEPNNVHEEPSPAIPRDLANYTQDRTPIPKSRVKSRVISPPSWLTTPRMEAGDARSRLHHVDPKGHRHLANSHVVSASETKVEHPETSAYRFHSVGDSFNRLTRSSLDLLRMAAPSPPTAMHVTQHQKPESWQHHSPAHVHSPASHELSPHMIGTPSNSLHENSPRVYQKSSSRHEHTHRRGHSPTHLQHQDTRYLRNKFLSPSSARSVALSRQTSKKFGPTHGLVHEHVRAEPVRRRTSYSGNQVDICMTREDGQSRLSSTVIPSHSPPQPQVVLEEDENTASEGRTSTLGLRRVSASVSDGMSDVEIHRPSPISPPNHECNWKERYFALAAEIRGLKAELTTRPSLRGTDIDYTRFDDERVTNEDEDLGIEGVTIVMHLRGREDLVIKTDLMQDPG
ncbi:hypothetical protein F5B19DRAFT_490386 [Rostrohypoxylon terebratum]|nr:hypothetical protein F5B19DRAFT_490386 [Rostrohypoxylon terebratum]